MSKLAAGAYEPKASGAELPIKVELVTLVTANYAVMIKSWTPPTFGSQAPADKPANPRG
ncbi:hypothetical protein ABIB44_000061 [Hymenobacter sp. UYCo722]